MEVDLRLRTRLTLAIVLLGLNGCSLLVPEADEFEYCEAGAPPCEGLVADAGPAFDAGMDASLTTDGGTDAGATSDAGADAGVPEIRRDSVAAGASHSCFVRSGDVFCSGSGRAVGTGGSTFRNTAIRVGGPLPNDIVGIAAGRDFTCALSQSGRLFCWGDNGEGQLGIGSNMPQDVPVRAADAYDDFDSVAATELTVCARRRTGELLCWGRGDDGELGNGSFVSSSTPVVSGVASPVRVSGGSAHFCAVGADGRVHCWGLNTNGALGSTGFGAREASPVEVPGVGGATDVGAGLHHSCATTSAGPRCWGNGTLGQIGNGSQQMQNSPTSPSGLPPTVDRIYAFFNRSCATDGINMWCWGQNLAGELGIGPTSTMEVDPAPLTPFPVAVADVAGFQMHTCAVLSDQEAYCWGRGFEGQLGHGMFDNSDVPVAVQFR